MKKSLTFLMFTACFAVTIKTNDLSAQQYCYPDVQMACFYGDKIVNVTFAGINHTDDVCDVDADGVKDFTSTVNPAQVTAGSSYTISVGVENSLDTGTERVRLWIDYNQDHIFQPSESVEIGVGTGTTVLSTTVAIPADAVAGTTRMRVMYRRTSTNPLNAGDACHSYGSFRGQLKDYAVTINSSSNCTAALNPGNTISTLSAACPEEPFTLSLQNVVSGTTYQWQRSANGVSWNDIAGATNPTLTTSQPTAFYYRCVVTCEGNSGYSAPVLVSSNGPVYASLPINESFENWSNACGGTMNVPGISWLTTPSTGNNSFRRNDSGASASWINASSGAYTPAASHGSYSARFHSAGTPSQVTGTLDVYIDCSTISDDKQVTFDYINTAGSDHLKVLLSTNGGSNFSQIGSVFATTPGWETKTIQFSSNSATTILRFEATSDNQDSDIGIDNVSVESNLTCNPPLNVTANTVNNSTVQTIWTASSPAPAGAYEYELNASPNAPGQNGTSHHQTSVTHYNLLPNTTYYFHVRSYCGGGEYSEWVTISFTTPPAPTTGIEHQTLETISCYPNPANDVLHIRSEYIITHMELASMNGEIISTWPGVNVSEITLPLTAESGMYFLQISTVNGWVSYPLSIIR